MSEPAAREERTRPAGSRRGVFVRTSRNGRYDQGMLTIYWEFWLEDGLWRSFQRNDNDYPIHNTGVVTYSPPRGNTYPLVLQPGESHQMRTFGEWEHPDPCAGSFANWYDLDENYFENATSPSATFEVTFVSPTPPGPTVDPSVVTTDDGAPVVTKKA